MENYSPRPLDTKNPSQNSRSSNNNSTNSTTSTTTNHHHHQHHHHPSPPATPIARSDPNNPYPTTFVQADTTSFKKVVQMLTGSSETAKQAAAARSDAHVRNPIPPMKTAPNKKPSKLYERRNSMKNFKISPLVPGFVNGSGFAGSPRRPGTPEILSPGILNFPSLVLSPVTPLIPDLFNRSPITGDSPNLDVEAEDKAIAKKGFYLHPSPASTPRRESEPRLLPLFPVTSPRVSGSS
ncbi:VQ motif-containing protein 4-like [Cynara cardunculus var. scolymus]|uniref:VQ-like protein n=1 Tax=Cynara cardunculus var. scolymus TaxID=59895 RepID=A0A103XU02_CYNCS|nr:VQ motif-containing protein 4-like [Cynara cardunculus var. scolymus]KVH96844.1 VQ-like protein [Cynara cardunculus var. scolymus]